MFVSANIFQPLIDVFQAVLKFFHDNLGVSWGWSIVLLTVCVRLVLVPLAIQQLHSMRKLQHVQPQLKALQAKYKDDKQRQQQEVMNFYRENEVNPLASCLPMVFQLPVFISLFYMLRQSLRKDICPQVQTWFQERYAHQHGISLHAALGQTTQCIGTPGLPAHLQHVAGAGFLFINDITSEAHGLTLAVLLILYVGTQIGSSMLMASPTMDKTQQRVMMLMPVVFVLFVIRFPAGLIVYWITTNTWTLAQQYVFKRIVGPPPAAAVATVEETAKSATKRGPTTAEVEAGGLGDRLRARLSPPQATKDADRESANGRSGGSRGTPPPPPRKRKKRSGRRR